MYVMKYFDLNTMHFSLQSWSHRTFTLNFIAYIVSFVYLMHAEALWYFSQISFQEFKNTLLEPGLVDHIEVANKSVAKVYVRSSPCTKDETSEDSVKGPDDSSSGGVSSKYKYYFNIGSVDSFEEKLEEAQEALGVDRHDFVPVIYVAQVNWFGELMKYAPTILLLGVLWFMGQKMPGIGGPGGSGGKGIFNIGKAQITKLDKNAKNKVKYTFQVLLVVFTRSLVIVMSET